uniref:Uncharacterized protein n=1 Tax=Anguilla anguilla TaxID=7936 RepID=A0A0E9XU71_ANGAN
MCTPKVFEIAHPLYRWPIDL